MSFIKSLVLPFPHHKKRSYLLQTKALIGYIIFVVILIYVSHRLTYSMPDVLGYAQHIDVSALFTDTNNMRNEKGLPSLKMNDKLSRAAKAKAEDMFAKDYWAHNSPDGKEPWDFIDAAGYNYLYAGENLAVDFNESQSVVDAWYDSPSHRENLLNKKYTEIGFAVVDGELEGRETTLVVQMFGYPRTTTPTVSTASSDSKETKPQEVQEKEKTVAQVPEKQKEEPKTVEETIPEKVEPEVTPIPEEETVETLPTDAGHAAPSINVIEPVRIPIMGTVLNSTAVFSASRYISLILGIFLTAMFAIDGYYIRKMGKFRFTGHTILHIIMILAAIAGIWYTEIGLVL